MLFHLAPPVSQDLSVAGLRKGLKHEENGDDETTRSGLFMEAIRIIKEMRKATNGLYPRFAIWENVPGAFSSNKGEDFRTVLEELIKIVEPSAVMPAVPKNGWSYADSYCGEGWSLAYRVFDAQYWGVPQRRRRIYLVLDLGGERAGEILFEREGLRGYFAEGRTPWQGTADKAENCPGADDREGENADSVAYGWPLGFRPENVRVYEETATTICNGTRPGFTCGVIEQLVLDDQDGQQINVRTDGKSPTLRADMHGNVPCIMDAVAFCQNQRDEVRDLGDVAGTLSAERGTHQQTFVAEKIILDDQGGSQITVRDDGKCPTLRAEMHGNVPCVLEPKTWDARGNGDGSVCSTVTGDHESRITDYTSLKMEPVGIDSYNLCETGSVGRTLSTPCGGLNEHIPCVYYPAVCGEPIYCIDGDKIGKAERAGGSGLGIRDGDKMYTLTAKDAGTHGVVYACSSKQQSLAVSEDMGNTLGANDYKEPQVVAYCVGNGQLNQITMAEQANTLDCMHDQQAIVYREAVIYIVRRLTPTECARLQGFADRWAVPDHKDDFTEEEYRFWLDVRNTHAAINGKAVKDYIKAQMVKWYNGLYTDSSSYKLWGNGIALPNALYVMQGIADVINQ